MNRTVGIKFKDYGQVYYFDSAGHELAPGDWAVVETDQGRGLGRVFSLHDELPQGVSADQVKPIVAPGTDADFAQQEENDALARQAHRFCRTRINERGLDMKLVEVEVFFDKSKIIFYFTAPGRVDFRELVKDLVREYRTRIELRQIGVRHETQMIGAVGNCGQLCCCRRFLRKFDPVTIKMAKEQNLFLNPTKISGICGRLLCCLGYEQHNYEEFQRRCPRIGRRVRTAIGSVKVLRSNFFRETLTVLTEQSEEREFSLDEWLEVVSGVEGSAPVEAETPRRGDPAAGGERGAGGAHGGRRAGGAPGVSEASGTFEASGPSGALAATGAADTPEAAEASAPDASAAGMPGGTGAPEESGAPAAGTPASEAAPAEEGGERRPERPAGEGQGRSQGRGGRGRRPRRRGGRRPDGGAKSES